MPYSGGFVGAFNPKTTPNISGTGSINQNWYGGPANINQLYISTPFTFTGLEATVSLLVLLTASGQYQYANFADTATISFINVPTGVTFTSASGEFLTGAATPLPAALPLFASGLGVIGFLAKRRKRKNAELAAV
jgi:hypothetical protein